MQPYRICNTGNDKGSSPGEAVEVWIRNFRRTLEQTSPHTELVNAMLEGVICIFLMEST